MTALLALIRKDLILYVGDRRALLLNLMMPIVLATFFGYLFGGSGTAGNAKITVALVALDDGEIGQKIAAALKADSTLSIQQLPLEQARSQVRDGKINVAIVIPAGFGEAAGAALFGAAAKPELPIYYDPSQSAVLAMAKGILVQHVMQTVSTEMFSGQAGQALVDRSLKQLEQQAAGSPQRPELRDFLGSVQRLQQTMPAMTKAAGEGGRSGGLSVPYSTRDEAMSAGPKYNGFGHSFAGMSVQFLLFMGIDAGIGILLARRQGMWNRLLAAPVSMGTILLARAVSATLIAFVLLCIIFGFAVLVLDVHIAGSLPGFIGIGLCFAVMVAAFGLVIAAFGKTPEAARGIAIAVTLIMVILGGAWVPAFVFPQWLQTFSLIVPTRWAVDGLDAMTWRGLGVQAAVAPMAVLLGFTLVFGALAWWKLQRDQNQPA